MELKKKEGEGVRERERVRGRGRGLLFYFIFITTVVAKLQKQWCLQILADLVLDSVCLLPQSILIFFFYLSVVYAKFDFRFRCWLRLWRGLGFWGSVPFPFLFHFVILFEENPAKPKTS